MSKFILFSIIGALGFLVDSVVFMALSGFFASWIARLASFFSAVVFTWLANRNLTFKKHNMDSSTFHEFIRYLSSMMVGGSVNYGCFILLDHFSNFIRCYPIIGIGIGSLLGLFLNFTTSKLFVFKK